MSSGTDDTGNGGIPGASPQAVAADSQLTLKCVDWLMAEKIGQANVNKGGMFLRTTRPMVVGDTVQVTIELPDKERVVVLATIKQVVTKEQAKQKNRPAGIGVQTSRDHLRELQALVQIAQIRQGKILDRDQKKAPVSDRKETRPVPRAGIPRGPAAGILGIDFGVTYSGVSAAIGDKVYMIPDDKGRTLLPSVVTYPETGEPLVGWEARPQQLIHPERTVASIKRLMGRNYSDQNIAGLLQYAPYSALAGPADSIIVDVGGERYATPQICAPIIKRLVDIASSHLNTPMNKAVFSIPVTFDEAQKSALKQAARIAGVEIVEMVEEPVAGALAYGFGQEKNEIVAVYDFGGGTFDFTVLDMSMDHYRVLVTEGDAWLGGDDFDLAMAEALANDFWQQTKVELQNRTVEWQRLLFACEKAKRQLSAESEAQLVLQKLIEAPKPMDLRHTITRERFQSICEDLVERSLDVCQSALSSIDLEPRDVTEVVVTGGTSRIPFVRDGVARLFDKEIKTLVNPEDAIALGNGLFAARLAEHAVTGAHSMP